PVRLGEGSDSEQQEMKETVTQTTTANKSNLPFPLSDNMAARGPHGQREVCFTHSLHHLPSTCFPSLHYCMSPWLCLHRQSNYDLLTNQISFEKDLI
uniref:Uncharacterized protein n=1 Tax=Salmo trutta TaxID=8032 RepID=A0A674A9T2_SALTR